MTSGFIRRLSNVWAGTEKCVLYFRYSGPQKWLRPEVSGGVDGDTKHCWRHHHRADGVPRPVFPATRSSVHWPDSCDGSWAIGVQVNVWRTIRYGGKYSAPDDVTCHIPGCGPELGGRRYRADCFNICRQCERSEKLDRCLVRSSNRSTLACRCSVCLAASDDSPSLNKICSHSPAARSSPRALQRPSSAKSGLAPARRANDMIGSTRSVPELHGGSVGPSCQMIRPFFRKRKSSKMRPLSRSDPE